MPQAVAAIFIKAIIAVAVSAATTIAVNAITRALTKKPKQFTPPVNVTVRNTIENRRILFGLRRCGGSFVYINTSSSTGSNQDLLWYVIALVGHEVNSITDVYLDNERVASADINAGTGAVTGATRFVGKLKIFKFLGTSTQAAQSDLNTAFAEITSDFRLKGTAYLVLQMTRDDVAFFQGPPTAVTAIVEGMKVYDQRNDSTAGGSGSHRKTNPSTWAYFTNPVWHIRWYLTGGSVHNTGETTRLVRYGLGESDDRIDDATFIAAANICDELLSGAEAPPGGVSVLRYASNLEASTGETHRAILQELLDAMAGTLVYVKGKWRIYAGAYDAPSHSFTEEDLYGELEVSDTTDGDDRYNQVSAVFIDGTSNMGFVETSTPFRTDSAYETQDGGEPIPREIGLRAVTNQYQAQRLAEIELRKSRMMRRIVITGALNLMKVAPWETFTLSHTRYGWVNRVFRCVEKQLDFGSEAGKVVLTAVQESAAVYNDLLTADYTTGTSATDDFKEELPDPPTNLTTETQVTSVKVTVTLPASFPPGAVVQLYEHTSSTPFSSAALVAQARQTVFIVQRRDEITRFYWARVKSESGAVSTTFPASTGTSGVPSFVLTADIANEAATEVSVVTDATETILLEDFVGPDLQAFATISIPAKSFAYRALMTATANVWKSGAAQILVFIAVDNGTTILDTSGGKIVTASASPGERVMDQVTSTVSAGQARNFKLFGQNNTTPASTVDMRNITLKVELIKK